MIRMSKITADADQLGESVDHVILTMSPKEFILVFELLREGINKAHIDRLNDADKMLRGLAFEFAKKEGHEDETPAMPGDQEGWHQGKPQKGEEAE